MAKVVQQAHIVVDLGFGDAGKGTVVDFLAREHAAHTVIRFNGGAQAAHNVIAPDGRHHTFAQFGSGTLVAGVQTYLARHMLIEPYAMFNEEAHLQSLGITDALARTQVDRRALVITPYQIAANRLRELARGADRHGSCGMGIGETVADSLAAPTDVVYAGDLDDSQTLRRKIRFWRAAKRESLAPLLPLLRTIDAAQPALATFEAEDLIDIAAENYAYLAQCVQLVDESALARILRAPGTVIFEGAQGVLLDEWYGFAPYTTWSTTTFANALAMLGTHTYDGQIRKLGVLRAYFTRHGPGPFVTEDATLTALLPDLHNVHSVWQRGFRVGYFDGVAARYAIKVCGGIDSLALTHLDRLPAIPDWQLCEAYEDYGARLTDIPVPRPPTLEGQSALTAQLLRCAPRYQSLTRDEGAYCERIETALGVRISLMSHGPSADQKRWVNR